MWFFKNKEDVKRVVVDGLSVSYGEKQIVKNITFEVKDRQIFSIIGLSGSGKSTILRSILKLQSYNGTIKVSGTIGYCPQENAFFSELSVRENIVLFGGLHNINVENSTKTGGKYLEKLGMSEYIDTIAKNLSGGQQKRLNIILSLLHTPDILILDEPFAGLDFYNRKILWDFLKELSSHGIIIILTTHLLNEAEEYADRIFVLKNGKRFAHGTANAILKSKHLELIIDAKNSYINKEMLADAKLFCERNKMHLLEFYKNKLSFGLEEENKEKLAGFLSKNKYEITEIRKPILDDLFLVAIND